MKVYKSKITAAGNGIWSKVRIDRNSCFGPYEGVIVYEEKEAHESGYSWMVRISPGIMYIGSHKNKFNKVLPGQ